MNLKPINPYQIIESLKREIAELTEENKRLKEEIADAKDTDEDLD